MSFGLGNLSGVGIAFLANANANNQSLQSAFNLSLLNKSIPTVGSRLHLNLSINSTLVDLAVPLNSTDNIAKAKSAAGTSTSFIPVKLFKMRSKSNRLFV